jgi:uncharacterized protein (DUF1778 family)
MTAARKPSATSLINLRADAATRDLIDRAATVAGQNRTEFMLSSARTHAEQVLLNQVYCQLDSAAWKALNAALESPPAANHALRKALRSAPAWKRQ